VGNTICVSLMSVGIMCRLYFSRSRPVITASTPGVASARDVSIFRILAWGYGVRTMSMNSMSGSTMSST
jgi:hypothetical protein